MIPCGMKQDDSRKLDHATLEAMRIRAVRSVPMERILGPQIGDFVRALHEEHGVVFHLEALKGRIHDRTRSFADNQNPLAPRAPSIHNSDIDCVLPQCLIPVSDAFTVDSSRPRRPIYGDGTVNRKQERRHSIWVSSS
jgi:hypothetical protein